MSEDFPSNWKLARLEDCLDALIDYRGKTPTKTTFGIPLVTARIIKGGRIEEPQEFIAEHDFDDWMRRGLPLPGDVVMTTEAPLGEIAQLDDRKVALAQRVITLRGKKGFLDNTFLRFLMQSSFVQEQLEGRASGTTVMGIRQSELRGVSLVIPPYKEQRAIARILAALEDKIDLSQRMNRTLEGVAAAVFRAWFVDFEPVVAKAAGRAPFGLASGAANLFPSAFTDSELGPIPHGWRVQPIGDVVRAVGGSTPSTTEPRYWSGGEHAWATPRDLANLSDPVLLATERQITSAGLERITSGLLPVGTVLLSSRAPIGYTAITEIPVAVNQGFIALDCNGPLPNHYVLEWVRENMEIIEGRANGTTFMEISKANFRPIPAIVPSSEILTQFSRLVGPWWRQIVQNVRESRTLAALRDSLLPKLLSGEVRVKQAERVLEKA